ncbi:MAG: hypothetical protein L6R40_004916 [Gallowayella cf. fulva]|nr:MAG: hypothetical protein L6R40_004916 [Xanthomendoza cf. fulva]
MKEARILHFYRGPNIFDEWHLSMPELKGLPANIESEAADVHSLIASRAYKRGAFQAIAVALGEGGCMYGWQIHAIGEHYEDDEGGQNTVVMVVRVE